MRETGWNHNDQYWNVLLQAAPMPCARALDVGCGRGMLARCLAERCGQVTGIDIDAATVAAASEACPANVTLLCGDVMTHPFEKESFDMVTVVATLHHLPLEAALARFSELLKPGGVLAVVGLYRARSVVDYGVFAAALPVSRMARVVWGDRKVGALLHAPAESLGEVRAVAAKLLPGSVVRRRFFFRYSLIWRKPA